MPTREKERKSPRLRGRERKGAETGREQEEPPRIRLERDRQTDRQRQREAQTHGAKSLVGVYF